MLVPLLERFVKRELAILLCRHAIAPRSRKMLVAQTDWNALDGIQSVGPQTQRYFLALSGSHKKLLHIFRHQSSLLRADIAAAHPCQVYLRSGQSDAGCLL